MPAREKMLARIRSVLGSRVELAQADLDEARDYILRHPAGPRPAVPADSLELFKRCAAAQTTSLAQVDALHAVPAEAARYLRENNLPASAVVWPELVSLPWEANGIRVEARPAQGADLVGITGVFCAIAETGTLMLVSGAETPAAASLLPETHIAVAPVARILPTMEDAWELLRRELAARNGKMPRTVNFVSGPSRTADIEQTVSLGAHGPYRVHIILVAEG